MCGWACCQGEFQSRDSMMVTSASGLLSVGSTKGTKLGLSAWPKSCTSKTVRSGDYTSDTWWHVATHEAIGFAAAFEGKDPDTQENLTPDGRRFVLWCICGDNDFYANDLYMLHWSRDEVCLTGRCTASRKSGPFQYNNFCKDTSQWITNPIPPQFFLTNHLASHKHPWFSAPGVTSLFLMLDVMHCSDQNGVLSHMIGNCFHSFVFQSYKALPKKDALAKMFSRVQELYDALGSQERISRCTLEMFCEDSSAPHQGAPCLGTAVKAAEQRHLLPVVYLMCFDKDFNDGSLHARLRLKAMTCLVRAYKTMDAADIVPTPSEGLVIKTSLIEFLETYQQLGVWAQQEGFLMYAMKPKMHYVYTSCVHFTFVLTQPPLVF